MAPMMTKLQHSLESKHAAMAYTVVTC